MLTCWKCVKSSSEWLGRVRGEVVRDSKQDQGRSEVTKLKKCRGRIWTLGWPSTEAVFLHPSLYTAQDSWFIASGGGWWQRPTPQYSCLFNHTDFDMAWSSCRFVSLHTEEQASRDRFWSAFLTLCVFGPGAELVTNAVRLTASWQESSGCPPPLSHFLLQKSRELVFWLCFTINFCF